MAMNLRPGAIKRSLAALSSLVGRQRRPAVQGIPGGYGTLRGHYDREGWLVDPPASYVKVAGGVYSVLETVKRVVSSS